MTSDRDRDAALSLDLDFDLSLATLWFTIETKPGCTIVSVPRERLPELRDSLGDLVRRCYVIDQQLETRSQELGRSVRELVEACLPDRPSTMAGDFGEIISAIFEATRHLPVVAIVPKKWRLKDDRNRPAPHSDVLHFILPGWPSATGEDVLVCSEVKTKSTSGGSQPISAAIEGARKDRTSRLTKTLLWLRERALMEDLGETQIDHLERFINSEGHPSYKKRFQAIACICKSVAEEVLVELPADDEELNCDLIVIQIPDLRDLYMHAFGSALESVSSCAASEAEGEEE